MTSSYIPPGSTCYSVMDKESRPMTFFERLYYDYEEAIWVIGTISTIIAVLCITAKLGAVFCLRKPIEPF